MKTGKQILLYVSIPCIAVSGLLLVEAFRHGIDSQWSVHITPLGAALSAIGLVSSLIVMRSKD